MKTDVSSGLTQLSIPLNRAVWPIDTRPGRTLQTVLDAAASNSFNFVPEHASELRGRLSQTPLTDGVVWPGSACGDSEIDPSSLTYSKYSAKSFFMTRRAMHLISGSQCETRSRSSCRSKNRKSPSSKIP